MKNEKLIKALKEISKINMKDVILWFNDNDIEYKDLNDIQMMIIYLENL